MESILKKILAREEHSPADDMQRGRMQKYINQGVELKEEIEELIEEGMVVEADKVTKKLDQLCKSHPEVLEYLEIDPKEHSFMNELGRGLHSSYPMLAKVIGKKKV